MALIPAFTAIPDQNSLGLRAAQSMGLSWVWAVFYNQSTLCVCKYFGTSGLLLSTYAFGHTVYVLLGNPKQGLAWVGRQWMQWEKAEQRMTGNGEQAYMPMTTKRWISILDYACSKGWLWCIAKLNCSRWLAASSIQGLTWISSW